MEPEDFIPQSATGEKFTVTVILDFILEESEAKEVNLALDLILNQEKKELSRGQALLYLAHFYLGHCRKQTVA